MDSRGSEGRCSVGGLWGYGYRRWGGREVEREKVSEGEAGRRLVSERQGRKGV